MISLYGVALFAHILGVLGMFTGMGLVNRRLMAIVRSAAAGEGALPAALERWIHDPVLWVGAHMVAGIALGIVFLMTTKPNLAGSLLVMAAALVVGGVSAFVTTRRGHHIEAMQYRPRPADGGPVPLV